MSLQHKCHLCKKCGTLHEKCEKYYAIKNKLDAYNEQRKANRGYNEFKGQAIDKERRISY